MTSPQNPASAPGPAGFDAQQRAAGPGGRRRADAPMRGSLGGDVPPAPSGPRPPAPRPMRFDLRGELAALAAEPHPFALWQRAEQLPDRFEHDQHRQPQDARPAPDRPEAPKTPGGGLAISGDLGGLDVPPGRPEPPAELSGSLGPEPLEEPQRPTGFSGGLSGSLLQDDPLSGPLPPIHDGLVGGLPSQAGPPSGPPPAGPPRHDAPLDGPPRRRDSGPLPQQGPPSGQLPQDGLPAPEPDASRHGAPPLDGPPSGPSPQVGGRRQDGPPPGWDGLPPHAGSIRELVLDDQRLRNDICWSVFDC
ncbi:hypothetical protein [Saccharopolyspora shandongensis]|uniref:hypothetical protein n=1 Tax=Saccharopolyspora shandongensis TaxID=418495 RepID=UPI0033DF801F